jgi:predicted aspartyl protease
MTNPPYPSVEIRFAAEGADGSRFALEDSGFEGHLAIPAALAQTLPPPSHLRRVRTASGEIVLVPVYSGTIELLGQPRVIDALIIALGDEFLIGIATMNHFRMTFDHGQHVIVEP